MSSLLNIRDQGQTKRFSLHSAEEIFALAKEHDAYPVQTSFCDDPHPEIYTFSKNGRRIEGAFHFPNIALENPSNFDDCGCLEHAQVVHRPAYLGSVLARANPIKESDAIVGTPYVLGSNDHGSNVQSLSPK